MVLLQHLRRTPLSPLLLQPTGAAARGRATPRRGRLRPDGTLLRARDLPYAKGGATATALLPSTSARPTSTAIPPSGAGARGGTRGGIRLHRPRPGAARPGSAPSVRVWRHRRGPPGRRRFSGSRGTAGSGGGNYRPAPARVRGYHRPGPRHHGWCQEPVLQLPNLPGPSTRRRNPAASRLRVPSRLRPHAYHTVAFAGCAQGIVVEKMIWIDQHGQPHVREQRFLGCSPRTCTGACDKSLSGICIG